MLGIRHAGAMGVAALVWLLSTGIALAAGPAQDGFDRNGNLPFLFAVYTVTWAAFFAYAFYMSRRQRELRRELDEIKRAMEEKETSQ
ncbi:MAG: CcmD family protein [Chloroflexi bacterium]|nr:CcmD family protein [Chloroflexota bacterium]